jgi:putative transposase
MEGSSKARPVFSSPLDEAYLWSAVRYVERNPVRAGMVRSADHYRWSSASAHCGKRIDEVLKLESGWSRQFMEMEDWSSWLAVEDEAEEIGILRRNIEKGLPCGFAGFIQEQGKRAGRFLEYHPHGRPKKQR